MAVAASLFFAIENDRFSKSKYDLETV